MLAIAEARAKGLELVARPLKTKVTFPSSALSFVIVICTVFTTHNHTVYLINKVLFILILKPPVTAFSFIEPFHLLLIGNGLKIHILFMNLSLVIILYCAGSCEDHIFVLLVIVLVTECS
jgi:hypothetical protein